MNGMSQLSSGGFEPGGVEYTIASAELPKQKVKVCVVTESRGLFTASRYGEDWRIGVMCADDADWIAFKIRENDWWRYVADDEKKQ